MTDFGYWQARANETGYVLCMICFEGKPVELMWWDECGQPWDICKACWEIEDKIMQMSEQERRKLADKIRDSYIDVESARPVEPKDFGS